MSVLSVTGLHKRFKRSGLWSADGAEVHAVNDVSFEVNEGETLAIVGESGSGKSTAARLAMRMIEPDAGRIELLGEDITALSGKAMIPMRRHIQMVFQDPFASLNPRMRVEETVAEGLKVHAPELDSAGRSQRVAEVLNDCGMGEETLKRYPHQFSGGQRQRIGIARALAISPKVLVLDEPVSALDVSVQAQILNLLKKLQGAHDLSYLFISHDLSVVHQVADRVAVMFAGRIVEQGAASDVFAKPSHPYTRALLAARPISHPDERRKASNEVPKDVEDVCASGCGFRLRCAEARTDCEAFDGELSDGLSNGTHAYACLHPLD